jgi:hypothetical protein
MSVIGQKFSWDFLVKNKIHLLVGYLLMCPKDFSMSFLSNDIQWLRANFREKHGSIWLTRNNLILKKIQLE